MATSKLPQPGDSVPSVYVYTLQLNVSLLGLGVVDIVNPVASARQVTFGTDASGNETVSYIANNGSIVSQSISGVGALQDSSAFSFMSGGTVYLLSNTALTGLLTATVNNTQVSVLPASTFSATQGQYMYPVGGTVVAPSGLRLDAGSDSGTKGDDITNVTTPVIDGTGEAGVTVTLQDGSTTIGTAIVGSNGTWSIKATALSTGTHSLTAYDTDGSGNVSARSAALGVTIETATPATPGSLTLATVSDSGTKGDDSTNVTNPIITGSGTAGDTVTLLSGSTVLGSDTVAANGTWSITSSTLAAGAHAITAEQTDPAGNFSTASAVLNLTIDTAAPAAPGTPVLASASDSGAKGDDITNVTTPVITGTGTVGDTITLYDGANVIGTGIVAANGTWSITSSTLAAGANSLTATQTDVAGNISVASAALGLTIDTTVPVTPSQPVLAAASDTGAKGDDITGATNPVITGTGTAGDTVNLYDGTTLVGTATVALNGTWSVTSSMLAAGAHSLTATQSEIAGNVSATSATLSLTIDTATPSAPSSVMLAAASDSGVAGDDTTNVTTPVITGTGTAGDTVTLYDGTAIVGTGTVAGNGTWSVTSSTLAAGGHSLTATQTDIAGNVSAASAVLGLTIDTTIPTTPSAPVLAPASDTGVASDDVTSVTTPIVTGTGTAGDTVNLYDGTAIVGTTIVAANGTWSVTSGALPAGANSLTATLTDVAGNVSAASAALNLTIDNTVPAAPSAPVLAASSDSGIAGDDITRFTTPVITGTGTAGDTVTLFDGSAVVGTTTVAANGTWSITSSTLAAGAHSLTATQSDIAGNVSAASTTLSLTIDTATPSTLAVPVLAAASDSGVAGDDITNVTTPVITGTGTAGDTVTLYDGTTLLGTTTVGGGGTWSITSSALPTGANSLTATQTDVAGNVSAASGPLTLSIETTAPAALSTPILAASSDTGVVGDGVTSVTTPAITGTGTAGDTVNLYDGTTLVGTATVALNGTWSVTSSMLAAGAHSLTATQSDVAGNVSATSAALSLTIDNTAPTAPSTPVLAPASDSGVAGDGITTIVTPTVTGTGAAGNTVSLYDGATLVGSATVASNDTWSITSSTLASGGHSLTATQTDVAGNVSSVSTALSLTIDNTAPTAPSTPVLAPASDSGVAGDDITNVVTPTLTGTGTAGDTVSLYDGATLVGTTTVASNGTWSVTSSALPAGTDSLTATEGDIAGNVSAASTALSLTIDTMVPVVPSAPMLAAASDSGITGDGVTNVTTPTLTGTGIAGNTVTLYDGTSIVGGGIVGPGGTWSIATATLAPGAQSITAVQADSAGNVSAASTPLSLTIDTATPATPTAPVLASTSDSGVAGDDITNVTTPTVTGTGTPGDTLTLLDGTTIVGTATVGAGGAWSVTSRTLAAGIHTLTAVQTDAAGNSSSGSPALTLTINTAAPSAPPTPVLSATSDTGVQGDDITSVTTPVITGTGTAGDTITLYDGSTAVGTGTVASNGTWAVTSSTLTSGANTLTATQTDAVGNVSAASGTLVLMIDTSAPTAPSAPVLASVSDSGVQGDDRTNVTTPVLNGSGPVGDTVTLYDGTTVIGTGTVGANNIWSITSTALTAGVHQLTATYTDSTGTASAPSSALTLTIDTAAPAAPSAPVLATASNSGAPGDNDTNVTSPTITGTGTAGDTVSLFDGTALVGTGVVGTNGAWSIATTTLANGMHSLSATQTDAAGNVSTASTALSLTIDTTAPAASSAPMLASTSDSGVAGDDITNFTTPTLTGTGIVGDTVTLLDGSTTVGSGVVGASATGSGGTWSITTTTLAPGMRNITAVQTSIAGNVSATSAALSLTIDTTPPSAPSAPVLAATSDSGTQGDDVTNAVTPTLTGTGTAGDTVTLFDGTTAIGAATVAANGTWSIASSMLTAGLHTLTTKEVDAAGNLSVASPALALTINTTAPAAPSAPVLAAASDSGVPNDNTTNVTTPTLTGTGIAGDTITLLDGSTTIGTTIVAADGTWSITTSMLPAGLQSLTATQSDYTGNVSTASTALSLTIDRATPLAPSAPILAPVSDSGVAGDDITNVTTPVITGTGTVGDTVSLFDGTTLLGTATVGGGGAWSITSSALPAGANSLTATEVDYAGNVSAASGPLTLTIDTMTPAAPSDLVLAAASDSGVQGDNITNVTTPTITGTGIGGDTVSLYDGTTLIGTAAVAADGTWSVNSSTLVDGTYDLTATQMDIAGNVSAGSAMLRLAIETAAPSAPSTAVLSAASDSGVLNDNITNVAAPVLTGTGTAGNTVTLLDGSVIVGSGIVGPDGTWSITTATLASGAQGITAVQTDVAGNISAASGTLNLAIDTTPPLAPSAPVLAGSSDSGVAGDDITDVTTPTVTGNGSAGDIVTLFDGTAIVGTGSVATDGSWSIVSDNLAAGTHSLTVTQTDAAGNVSAASAPLGLTIDTATPDASSVPVLAASSDSGVAGDDTTNVRTPTITGTGTAGDTVTLYDGGAIVGVATVAANGAWSVSSSTLSAGTNTLTATQTDVAGNVSGISGPLVLDIDTTVPAAPSTPVLAAGSDSGVANDDITNFVTPTLTGTGIAGATISLYDGTTLVGTTTVAGNDTWSVTSSALPAGTDSITATQTDTAGNVSSASAALELNINTVPPSAPTDLVLAAASDSGIKGDDITNAATPTITGLGVPDDIVTLLDGSTPIGTATVAANGTWSITSSALADGTYGLTAIQTDVAGNVSAASGVLGVTIDTTAPDAPASLTLATASDSGVAGDNITNVTTPTITGTGTAGDTITLHDGTSVIGTATVAANDTWSVTVGTLASGGHSLTATQTDIAGNVSAASGPLNLSIETTTPVAPSTPDLAAASDSGVAGDDITNVTTPTVTGTGTTGDTVTLLDGTTVMGSAVVGSGGTWSIASSTLAAGSNSLTTTETDVAGNRSAASAPLIVTIDTAAPAAPAGLVLSGTTLGGTVASGDTVTVQEDGQTLGTTQAASNGRFTLNLTAAETTGLQTLNVTATDVAGNISAAANLVVGAFHWAAPVSAAFSQSGQWLVDGAQTASVPSAPTDFAYFDTGSPDAYAVSGNGTAGEVRVDGDRVTYSGSLTLSGLQDSAAGGDTSLVVDEGGSLTVGTGTTVLDGAAMVVGGTTAGTLTLSGTLSDTSADIGAGGLVVAGSGATWSTSGNLTLGSGGTLILDDTAQLTGTLLLDGGVLTAQPDADGNTDVVLSDSLQGVAGTTSYVGSVAGASLTLSGSRTLAAGELIYRGGTIILDGALPTDAVPAVVDGAVLELGGEAEPGTAAITTLAGTTNTLVLNADTASVASNGNDSIELGSGNVAVTITGAAAIVGGSGNATINATGSAVTISGGTGNIVITGTANAIINASNSKNVTYSGTGQVSFTGVTDDTGVTLNVTTGGTINTAAGGETTVDLGTDAAIINSMGSDTIYAASGSATINSTGASLMVHAGSGSLMVNGGSGPITVLGGSGSTTVSGGSASAVIVGGAAGGLLTGGAAGDSVLVSNGSAGVGTTIQAEGAGNQIFGSAAGHDVLAMGSGRSSVLGGGGATTVDGGATGSVIFTGSGPTLVVAGAGGQDTIVGGAGSLNVLAQHGEAIFGGSGALDVSGSTTGADSIIGGGGALTVAGRGGNMLVVGAPGASNINTGNGASLIFAGAGNMTLNGGSGSMQVIVGSGNAMIAEGGGPTSYDVIGGSAGGIDIVSGFKVGTDKIDLFGYQSSQVDILSNGVNSIVQLSDGTKIELLGVPHPNASVVG